MKTYRILEHPDGSTEAVKDGFSWPAFFLGIFWCLAQGLRRQAALIALGCLAFVLAALAIQALAPGLLSAWTQVGNVAGFVVALVCGFLGNDWRMESLCARGFRIRPGEVEAGSDAEALETIAAARLARR